MTIRAGVAGCVLFASCTFHQGTPTSGGEQTLTTTDDTASDFTHGTLDSITVDPLGLLAPDAFLVGGLHARAYGMPGLTATMSWQEISQMNLGPMLGERYSELPVTNWSNDRPYGLGLYRADNFTVLYDGEIYLPAGRTTLQILADDFGLFEVDLGAIKAAGHAAASDGGSGSLLTVTAPHDGWYPVRAAVSENFGSATFVINTVAASVATPIGRDRMRARITSARGMLVSASDDRVMRNPFGASTIDPAFVDRDFTSFPPYDLPGLTGNNYVLRYTGQLRIEQSNLYYFSFKLDPDPNDYARLLIDGVAIAGNWPGGVGKLTSDVIELEPGWHDILLDYSQANGASALQLLMGTSTSGAAAIPPARLRPVRRTGLTATIKGVTTLQLVDATDPATPGVAMVAFPIAAPPDAVVDFTDYFFQMINEPRSDLQIKLVQPAGTDAQPLAPTPNMENQFDEIANRSTLSGAPAAAGWQAVFTDSVPNGGSAGQVWYSQLMVTYHGGPGGPFAQTATYISAPHPTEGATRIDAIRVAAKLDGAKLTIAVRTGDAGSIEHAPWIDVVSGDAPAVDASAVVEYRLTVISDGWQFPTIDKVEIDYTVPIR